MNTDNCEFEAAFQAGLAAAEVRQAQPNAVPFVVVPHGTTVATLEDHLQQPVRRRGTLSFSELGSLVAYVNRHKDERTMVYATVTASGLALSVVLDDHGTDDDEAGWGQHRASFAPQATVEWERWRKQNKTMMAQKEFAEFMEENLAQIVDPNGATMLEITRRLEAKTTVDFTSAIRLENGNEQFVYEEKTEAKAGEKGTLVVPSVFTIGLVLFEGAAPYKLDARLRYRIQEKQLKLWYDLVNPHLVVKDAVGSMLEAFRTETGLAVLYGTRQA